MAATKQMKIYNISGKTTKAIVLSPEIFNDKENSALLSQVIKAKRSNLRSAFASTKTRGETRGGGRKPFRQKGTGRARAGSSRSPIWIGGGITFGPRKNKNYTKRISKKMNQAAIKIVLSQKAKEKRLIILDDFELSKISTKNIQEIFEKLPIEEGSILVILAQSTPFLEASLANLSYLKVIQTINLNLLDLLKYEWVITTVEGLKKIEKLLSKTKEIK